MTYDLANGLLDLLEKNGPWKLCDAKVYHARTWVDFDFGVQAKSCVEGLYHTCYSTIRFPLSEWGSDEMQALMRRIEKLQAQKEAK